MKIEETRQVGSDVAGLATVAVSEAGRPVHGVIATRGQAEQIAKPPVKKPNLGRFASQTFRGRYSLMIVLGIIAGGASAYLGWSLSKPVYRSEGLVRIAYSLPAVIKETDQNKPMDSFDTFMQSQRMLITSRRTIDMAIQDSIWKAMNRSAPSSPDKYFSANLLVDIKPHSEFIRIVASDNDPAMAAAAATSIVNAYVDLYNDREKQFQRPRFGKLEEVQTGLQTKINELNKKIDAIASEFGTTDLDMFYVAKVADVRRLESALAGYKDAMGAAKPWSGEKPTPATKPAKDPVKNDEDEKMTDAEVAKVDQATHNYLAKQEQLEEQLEKMTSQGWGDGHPSVKAVKAEIVRAQARVAKAVEGYRSIRALAGPEGTDLLHPLLTAHLSLEELQTRVTRTEELLNKNRADMIRIGLNQRAAKDMEGNLASLRADLYKLTERESTLHTEDMGIGRLSVFSTGEIPLSPDHDPRIRLAAATGVAGFTLPSAFLLLTAFMWRKFRYSDDMDIDAGAGNAPLLGILPELSEGGAGRDEMLAAAHSIHQIRVSLQSRSTPGPQTYLITSATAGEGKTSLTLSLGLSFAVSKERTLVIDGDLVGRHLTRKLELQNTDGLHEALETGSIENLLRCTDDGLYVLTAGRAASHDAYAVPAPKIRSLLIEARRHFDVILIDTGPILGSVEAAVLAQEVDGVIFTVTRGQQQRLVTQAMARLNGLGVRILGLIFNRAKPEDFRRSPYGSSYRSISVRLASESAESRINGLKAFGPLVNAVDGEHSKEPS